MGDSPPFRVSEAALDDAALPYLTVRQGDDDAGRYWEIGTVGHGPRAASLAHDLADAVREWDRDYGNQAPAPGLRMAPAAYRDLLTAPDPRSSSTSPPAAWSPTGGGKEARAMGTAPAARIPLVCPHTGPGSNSWAARPRLPTGRRPARWRIRH
jgi:hypothetical protein